MDGVAKNAYNVSRGLERVPVSIPVTLVIESEGKKVGHPAYMIDVSAQGLRLKTRVPLAPEQTVEIEPNEGPSYVVRGRVIWVAVPQASQEVEAGLEFLQRFPTSTWATKSAGEETR